MLRRSSTLLLALPLACFAVRAQAPGPAQPSPLVDSPSPNAAYNAAHEEDWTALELSRSKLPMDSYGGALISKVELPGGCTRELLRMKWRPNDPFELTVIRPVSAAKLPVALFLYNYTVDSEIFRQDRWCSRARENGFAIVGFPIALSESRLHAPRPMREWFVSELQESLATSTHDVQMVLHYLHARGDLDTSRVGVFGQGSGAAVAVLAASVDKRIAALDLMDPWGDWPAWLRESKQIPEDERPSYLTRAFLASVAGLDPVTYLPQLGGRPLRIQQTADDLITPLPVQQAIEASAHGAVTRYPDREAEAKALGPNGILGWLGQQIGATPLASPQLPVKP
jgi:hypothetical protein